MSDEHHRWIIDRFEGDLAVVEVDGARMMDLPRWLLPANAREDDVLVAACRADDDGLTVRVRVDEQATERAREEARKLIDELREGDPGGDLTL